MTCVHSPGKLAAYDNLAALHSLEWSQVHDVQVLHDVEVMHHVHVIHPSSSFRVDLDVARAGGGQEEGVEGGQGVEMMEDVDTAHTIEAAADDDMIRRRGGAAAAVKLGQVNRIENAWEDLAPHLFSNSLLNARAVRSEQQHVIQLMNRDGGFNARMPLLQAHQRKLNVLTKARIAQAKTDFLHQAQKSYRSVTDMRENMQVYVQRQKGLHKHGIPVRTYMGTSV